MSAIFSDQNKYSTWRKLWIALAKAEKALGLPITGAQIASMEAKVDAIDFARALEIEKETHHDVVAHIHAFGEVCPKAKGIIHLGATSAFVTDNTDVMQMRLALQLLKKKSLELLHILKNLAEEYAAFPCLAYTHLQPAQPTTVGKRICLWLQDFYIDTKDLIAREEDLHFLGLKGATGTQASFMILFDHDSAKVEKLDQLVAKEMGFKKLFAISGQTYTRKQDQRIFAALEGFAASSHKCATDLRLLAHFGEMREGRGKDQVGSSAMPHKRNPIYSERICALSRFLISLCQNPSYTLATQWLERSLDDSANRRLIIPDAFLTADAILSLLIDIFSNLQIDPESIEKNLNEKLPLLAMENLLMLAVKKGQDRQEAHEKLRAHPEKTTEIAKTLGLTDEEIEICHRAQTGRAQQQVLQFLENLEF